MFKLTVSGLAILSLILPHLGEGVGSEAAMTSLTARAAMVTSDSTPLGFGIVLQPYTARRGADEISVAPELLYPEVVRVLQQLEIESMRTERVELTPDEENLYGVWRRLALADAHLGAAVTSMAQEDVFPLGLLGNCNSSLGMLAGLQHAGSSSRPLKVGLIWIDAHADFNTPETTMSGWLGGMPVSVAAGRSLFRLRLMAGLDPPISTRNIVMMGLRDVDPLEQVLVDESEIETISTEEMLQASPRMQQALQRLSNRVDVLYLHIDLDILDATEIPGSFFEVSGGPTADELAEPIRALMQNPKVGALGIASFPTAEEGRVRSMESTMTLIQAAMTGLSERQPPGRGAR
jgi:arginase